MSQDRFEQLVSEALEEIPPELAPLTERDWAYGGQPPDRITIFRSPTLPMCRTEDEVVDEVHITVVHEIAHHFGIDDDRLHALGYE